jgi:hypothetical protein
MFFEVAKGAYYLYQFLNISLAQAKSGKTLLLYVQLCLCVYQCNKHAVHLKARNVWESTDKTNQRGPPS